MESTGTFIGFEDVACVRLDDKLRHDAGLSERVAPTLALGHEPGGRAVEGGMASFWRAEARS